MRLNGLSNMIHRGAFIKFMGLGMVATLIAVGTGIAPRAQAIGSKHPRSQVTIVEVAPPGTYVWFRGTLGPVHMETDATGVATSPPMRVQQGQYVTIQQMPGRTLPSLQSVNCAGTTFVKYEQMGDESVTMQIASQNTVVTFTNNAV